MEKELAMLLERCCMLEEEINKIRRAVNSISNGEPITESFCEDLYESSNTEKKSCMSHLAVIIEHLLKIKYSTSDGYKLRDGWRKEILEHRKNIIRISRWGTKKANQNYINHMEQNVQDAYEDGVSSYISDSREWEDLRDGIKFIPDDCAWTVEQLMESNINELISMLPGTE